MAGATMSMPAGARETPATPLVPSAAARGAAVAAILLLIGAIPSWPYSRGWGYGPSGIVGVILVVLLILVLLDRV